MLLSKETRNQFCQIKMLLIMDSSYVDFALKHLSSVNFLRNSSHVVLLQGADMEWVAYVHYVS
ncbi:CLUMA_CG015804, isoform A [Clunio marinus]|uniref:CLUMA_CG015804, isoform A n=1 Tax=Clunio marinus TaxID=568069 RepID=A0A1J1IRL5_9DIPT|nr:CLUMA_CG015804, isoform A [Clunio marinus]